MADKLAWAEREGVTVPEYADTTRGLMLAAAGESVCPLCPSASGIGCEPATNSVEPTEGEGAPTPGVGQTELVPMGCSRLASLIVLAPTLGVRPAAVAERPVGPRAVRGFTDDGRAPGKWPLTVEPPPPRACTI